MIDDTTNLVLEHLRAIRGQLDLQGERLDRIEFRLGAVEHHLGLILASSASDRNGEP